MSNTAQTLSFTTVYPAVSLSENARTVLSKRYLRKGPDGKPIETPEQMFRRVARAIAQPEADHGGDAAAMEEAFYSLLASLRFFPNSPTFTGAGRQACWTTQAIQLSQTVQSNESFNIG
jgi:ribonucleotide reductase alpha subunit